MIFSINGDRIKKTMSHSTRPPQVTISLTYLPPAVTVKNIQSVQEVDKKSGEKKPEQSEITEKFTGPSAGQQRITGDPVKRDIPQESGLTEADALKDVKPLPFAAEKKGDFKQETFIKSYDDGNGEIRPAPSIIKEAIPLYKENPAPVYPLKAKKRGYEGVVVLDVLVTKEGIAGKIGVFQSSRYSILDEAAVLSVKKWRFVPGERGGQKVDMQVKIPVRFKLESE